MTFIAEKAFAIYTNSKLKNNAYLKLLINDPDTHMNEPMSNAYILQVKQLTLQTTTNFSLYNLFRPYGPLFSCRMQYQDNKFRGCALVQFFRQEDAEKAAMALVNTYILFYCLYTSILAYQINLNITYKLTNNIFN